MKQDAPPRMSYTVPETATALGLSERQVRRLISKGEIEAKLLGGRILVPADVFNQLINDAPSAAS